jgi:hypothetical protein
MALDHSQLNHAFIILAAGDIKNYLGTVLALPDRQDI